MESRALWAVFLATTLAVPALAKGKAKKADSEYDHSRYKSKNMEPGGHYIFKSDSPSKYKIDSEDSDVEVAPKRKAKKGKKAEADDDELGESRYKSKMLQNPRHYRFSEEGTPLDEPGAKVAKGKKAKDEEPAAEHAAAPAPEGGGPPPAQLAGGGKKPQLKAMGGGGLKGIGGGGGGIGGVGGGMKGFGNAGGNKNFKKIAPIAGGAEKPAGPPPGGAPPGGPGDATAQGQVAK